MTSTTAFRTCPLCEAGCGLRLDLADGRVTRIRGDLEDVFSAGFLCPKGTVLGHFHEDPDRLRSPMVRSDGELRPATWAEAYDRIAEGLEGVWRRHGRGALGVYLGNPMAHNLDGAMTSRTMLRSLAPGAVFSASTVDQRPRELASGLLYGQSGTIPVPDIDRTEFMIMLGANPLVSNGSLATAPDWPGRLAALRTRGGELVVVDPVRTKTAEIADDHLAIVPGTDVLFLAALVTALVDGQHVDLDVLPDHFRGLDVVVAALAPFTPEAVEGRCGIPAPAIRDLAARFAAADRAVVYGRIGTTVTPFGTTASWLIDVVNAVTGNLDAPGGAMFSRPASGSATTRGRREDGRSRRPFSRSTRVDELPIVLGEYPAAAMADEILTEGEGQLRAMLTVGGNPVLSCPDSERFDTALASLEFMVAVDCYVNETTRHADVILPAPSHLEKPHYDVALLGLAIRNVANYSPPVLELADDADREWQMLLRLAGLGLGMGMGDEVVAALDDEAAARSIRSALGDPAAPDGLDAVEAKAMVDVRQGPERMLDIQLRTGPYGDWFGANPDGLSLDVLEANPHGIDLGALEPRLPAAIRTSSGDVEFDQEDLMADLDRVRHLLHEAEPPFVLTGRRTLRSNNSWMHNMRTLVKGKARCTLQVHPDDAASLGLVAGGAARVTSRSGSVIAPVEVTDVVRPGVVSLPHGWGHDAEGSRLRVAAEHAGVNSNILTPADVVDPLSGTSQLTGIPVEIVPA